MLMKARHFLSSGLAAILLISASAYAAEGDKPDAKATETKNTRLIRPFSELKDLSPDQTEKLKAVVAQKNEKPMASQASSRELVVRKPGA